MKNESSKYYFTLDSKDFTAYPEEQEILIQAGLKFKLESIIDNQSLMGLTIVNLKTSERFIFRERL